MRASTSITCAFALSVASTGGATAGVARLVAEVDAVVLNEDMMVLKVNGTQRDC
jgi:hypothetical protein